MKTEQKLFMGLSKKQKCISRLVRPQVGCHPSPIPEKSTRPYRSAGVVQVGEPLLAHYSPSLFPTFLSLVFNLAKITMETVSTIGYPSLCSYFTIRHVNPTR
ncbi:hypothetical protein TNCT_709661 [Trichonephila clavata]|uniref:Uncharacterized protein n=1 Tax=Trichonephila clavata TaxID=2740835 RepID=A0A8X6IKU2_TRICU|nr:hypothetical protein TNCT_709661 [Trichonephila clavata]